MKDTYQPNLPTKDELLKTDKLFDDILYHIFIQKYIIDLYNDNKEIKRSAIFALDGAGNLSAIKHLQKFENDEDEEIAILVKKSIGSIKKRD